MGSMNKKTSILIGTSLLAIAICFVCYAFNHPEASFPWGNRITYLFYGVYIWLLFKFLLDIPVFQKIKSTTSDGMPMRAIIFFMIAIVFFIMEITGESVNVYTIIRGFVVVGGVDVGIESVCLYVKQRGR